MLLTARTDKEDPENLDRYEDFLSYTKLGSLKGWSARKTFCPDDLAIFYMALPLSSAVALGVVNSLPYEDEGDDFTNPIFCDYKPVWLLKRMVPIQHIIAEQKLHKWWKTRPFQSIRRLEENVAQAIIQEVVEANPFLYSKLKKAGLEIRIP